MWKFYQKYWLPFGEVLTDLEREGIKVDLDHMREIR
jgi:DNA polymerase-1